jgi:hypothetical protein
MMEHWGRLLAIGMLLAGLTGVPTLHADEADLSLLAGLQADGATERLAALVQLAAASGSLSATDRHNLAGQLGPRLTHLAGDDDPRIQQAALEAIHRLGVAAEVAAPAYARAASAIEVRPRQIVAQAVSQRLDAGFQEVLRDAAGQARHAALAQWLSDAQHLTPVCAKLLADRDPGIRQKTMMTCDRVWHNLVRLSGMEGESGDYSARAQIREQLPRTAQAWADLAPALLPLLHEGPLGERVRAGRALEALARLLRSWERQALTWSLTADQAQALRAANETLAGQIPGLLAALPNAQPELQLAALGVLEALEADAEPARPLILDLAGRARSSFVRWNCLRILAHLSAPRGGADWLRISRLLEDDDADVRSAALRLLADWAASPRSEEMTLAALNSPHGNAPADLRGSVAILAEILKRGAPAEQIAAAQVLGRLGEQAIPSLPAFEAALKHAGPEVRRVLPAALRQIGRQARNSLETALTDADEEVRAAAASALLHLPKS